MIYQWTRKVYKYVKNEFNNSPNLCEQIFLQIQTVDKKHIKLFSNSENKLGCLSMEITPPPLISLKTVNCMREGEVTQTKCLTKLPFEGFSDPYVLVQFCPEHVFHDVPVQQTSIQKKTLNPVFDESFEL